MSRCVKIKEQIDDKKGSQEEDPIPLPTITNATLLLVIEFLGHLRAGNPAPEIEKPLRSKDLRDVTTEWYANFIDRDDDIVQDLLLAANYLDLKELEVLACAKLGSIIKGMSVVEFRQRFNIVNDFTPEEEAEPFDEAKLAELAEAFERQKEEQEQAEKAKREEEDKQRATLGKEAGP